MLLLTSAPVLAVMAQVRRERRSVPASASLAPCKRVVVAGNYPNGGLTGNIPNGTTDYIWQGWQTMEERNPFGGSGSTDTPIKQFVWGTYIDECLQINLLSVGGIAGDLFKMGRALIEARRAIQALRDFAAAGPLFESALGDAKGAFCISGALGATEASSFAAVPIQAAASALTSYAIFGNQAEALSTALNSALKQLLNGGIRGAGTAYEIISTMEKVLNAAYAGSGGLPKYITGLSRREYAARLAHALRQYNAAMAHCRCRCGANGRE